MRRVCVTVGSFAVATLAGLLWAQQQGAQTVTIDGMIRKVDKTGLVVFARSGKHQGEVLRIGGGPQTQLIMLVKSSLDELKPGTPVQVLVGWLGGTAMTARSIRVLPMAPPVGGVFDQEGRPFRPEQGQRTRQRPARKPATPLSLLVRGVLAKLTAQQIIVTVAPGQTLAIQLPADTSRFEVRKQMPATAQNLAEGDVVRVVALPVAGAYIAAKIEIMKDTAPGLGEGQGPGQGQLGEEQGPESKVEKKGRRHRRMHRTTRGKKAELPAGLEQPKRHKPPAHGTSTLSKAERYFLLGMNLLKNRRIDKAKKYFDKALKEDSSPEMKKKIEAALKKAKQ